MANYITHTFQRNTLTYDEVVNRITQMLDKPYLKISYPQLMEATAVVHTHLREHYSIPPLKDTYYYEFLQDIDCWFYDHTFFDERETNTQAIIPLKEYTDLLKERLALLVPVEQTAGELCEPVDYIPDISEELTLLQNNIRAMLGTGTWYSSKELNDVWDSMIGVNLNEEEGENI